MRRAQLCAWLLCVRRVVSLKFGLLNDPSSVCVVLPIEVKESIDGYVGGKYVWGPITAVARTSGCRRNRWRLCMVVDVVDALEPRHVPMQLPSPLNDN